MKKLIFLFSAFYAIGAFAQSTYTSSDYATAGDTLYLTSAQITTANFDTTGANFTWNYASLTGNSQQQLLFRAPSATGFTVLQWPYIFNPNNVNLSSTNQQTISVGNLKETNPNDYFLTNTGVLEQKASSYNIATDSISVSIKNVYSSPDVFYKFPLNYTDTFSSVGGYTTSIPSLYYNNYQVSRTNTVDGWGTVITPAGTYSHCLRISSIVEQVDTIAVAGTGIPTITTQYRELKWLDTSKGYPVLDVKQTKTANTYITSSIQYLDKQQFFQPVAAFAYYPVAPSPGDTVNFENLSTNSTSYKWNFGDDSTSTLQNPQHVFLSSGTYEVQLIAFNGPLSDTITEPVKVTGTLPVSLLYFTATKNSASNLLQWATASAINTAYFEVEKSTDAIHFTDLAKVTARAGSATADYAATDNNAPATGIIYYRLKIVSVNGQFTYSNTVAVQSNAGEGFSAKLLPSPIIQNETANIIFHSPVAATLTVKIVSISGQMVGSAQFSLSPGDNIFPITHNSLPAGAYIVQYKGAAANMQGTIKMIVVK